MPGPPLAIGTYTDSHPPAERAIAAAHMATFPLDRTLGLCRRVPRAMVEAALHAGTAEDVAPRLAAEIEAGARHVVLCNDLGFLSREDAPAATAELVKLAGLGRRRFAE